MPPDVLERVSLEEILLRHGLLLPEDTNADYVTIRSRMEKPRRREEMMRSILHDRIVRRVAPGFARCATIHPDTSWALFALVCALKARIVYETGTYWGYASSFLAAAVARHPTGMLYTIDLSRESGRYVPKSMQHHVTFLRGVPGVSALHTLLPTATPELFFQDSVHDYEGVRAELGEVAPFLPKGGIIALHDAAVAGVQDAVMTLSGFARYLVVSRDPQALAVAVKL